MQLKKRQLVKSILSVPHATSKSNTLFFVPQSLRRRGFRHPFLHLGGFRTLSVPSPPFFSVPSPKNKKRPPSKEKPLS